MKIENHLMQYEQFAYFSIVLKRIQSWWNFGRSCKIWRLRWRKCWLGSLHLWTSRKAIKRRLLFPRSWSRWTRSGSENINFLIFWLINLKTLSRRKFFGLWLGLLDGKKAPSINEFCWKTSEETCLWSQENKKSKK